MADANFSVEHECPQCGGAVRLGESDRLLVCPYCRARLALWPGRDPLWFWVPAFPIAPGPFLRVARQLTMAQLPLDAEIPEGTEWESVQAATIEAAKAFGAVNVLLAQLGQPRRQIFPMIPKVQAALVDARLALLPFSETAGDWIQPRTGAAISRATLRMGA